MENKNLQLSKIALYEIIAEHADKSKNVLAVKRPNTPKKNIVTLKIPAPKKNESALSFASIFDLRKNTLRPKLENKMKNKNAVNKFRVMFFVKNAIDFKNETF